MAYERRPKTPEQIEADRFEAILGAMNAMAVRRAIKETQTRPGLEAVADQITGLGKVIWQQTDTVGSLRLTEVTDDNGAEGVEVAVIYDIEHIEGAMLVSEIHDGQTLTLTAPNTVNGYNCYGVLQHEDGTYHYEGGESEPIVPEKLAHYASFVEEMNQKDPRRTGAER